MRDDAEDDAPRLSMPRATLNGEASPVVKDVEVYLD